MPNASVREKEMPRSRLLMAPKSGLRPAVVAPETPGVAEALAEALAARPRVDFRDPLIRQAAMQASKYSLCAFLVTLAAYQRGLKVTFHYQRASNDARFAQTLRPGYGGDLFSISDGCRTHVFYGTLGDRADPAACTVAYDRHLTRSALDRAGIPCPDGVVAERGQSERVRQFLTQAPGRRFVVKPLVGSTARDMYINLPVDDVLPTLAMVSSPRLLLEEHIDGDAYRALVVAGQCIAIYWRHAAHVVGDGVSSVRDLIAQKNAKRQRNPYLASQLIDEPDSAFLAEQGVTLDSVLADGESVMLSTVASISRGGDPVDMTQSAPAAVAREATRACAAVGLDVAGVDLIVRGGGADAQAFVVDLDPSPAIGAHSFPARGGGQSNAVAEAIVDHYFPDSAARRTRPNLVYDFAAVPAALISAQLAEVDLPVVGPDWRILRFNMTRGAANVAVEPYQAAIRAAGVHGFVSSLPDGGVALCLAVAPAQLPRLKALMPIQPSSPLEAVGANI